MQRTFTDSNRIDKEIKLIIELKEIKQEFKT
jgi:hypothetical protein